MIAIIDYKAGNLTSVRYAFEAIGADCVISDRPEVIARADRVVFPGVGAAAAAMRNLRECGLEAPIRDAVRSGKPFLGICLGTQILLERSEEDGGTPTLGLLPGETIRFKFDDKRVKIPEIGWNQVNFARRHPLVDGISDGTDFYFVHSYYPHPANDAHVLGRTDYAGQVFCSMVACGNLAATQFHPEKSGRAGLKLLENFCGWDGKEAL